MSCSRPGLAAAPVQRPDGKHALPEIRASIDQTRADRAPADQAPVDQVFIDRTASGGNAADQDTIDLTASHQGAGSRRTADTAASDRGAALTEILTRWSKGEPEALSELMPLVYTRLHELAAGAMRNERPDHTLQPTALVHETFLRLSKATPPELRDRAHFFTIVARMMRRILVDHARGVTAKRRGGEMRRVSLRDEDSYRLARSIELLALDESLDDLARLDPRKALVIELRFFAGLSVAETSELLGVSRPTIVLDTRLARAWLYRKLDRGSSGS